MTGTSRRPRGYSDTMEPPPPLTAAESIVVHSVACTRCGYNLRGLSATGKCPECGWSVDASLRGGLLAYSGPEYLEALVTGSTVVIWTNIANAVLNLGMVAAVFVILALSGASPSGAGQGGPLPGIAALQLMEVGATGLGLLVTAASLLGYWLLTSPDPGTAATEQPRAARRVVRGAVIASTGVQLVALVLHLLGPGTFASGAGTPVAPNAFSHAAQAMGVAGTLLLVVQFFAMMLYVRWLALRVPTEDLVKQTQIYMWLLPLLAVVGAVCVGIGPLIAWVLYVVLIWRLRRFLRAAREQALTLKVG